MKRPVIQREAPTPLSRERGARRYGTPGRGARPGGARRGRLRSPGPGGAPRRRARGGLARPALQLAELVFAAVRPGFVAACMVSAAAVGDGRRAGQGGHPSDGDRRPGRPVRKRRAAPWLRCARANPRGGARADGGTLFNDQALRDRTGCRQNRQMAYFAGQEAGLRGGVHRDTAIIPRDRGSARDLRLTTLRSDSCV